MDSGYVERTVGNKRKCIINNQATTYCELTITQNSKNSSTNKKLVKDTILLSVRKQRKHETAKKEFSLLLGDLIGRSSPKGLDPSTQLSQPTRCLTV